MSTGPRDLMPSTASTGLDAEAENIRNQLRTEGSAASRGATMARSVSAISEGPSFSTMVKTSSRSAGVVPQG
jgi:hypothetical protein